MTEAVASIQIESSMPKKIVLTYGTFDLFHIGHLRLLQRLRGLGDQLIVGVSTDEFNTIKGKKTIVEYEHRAAIVAGLSCVDGVFPEENWDQKISDIANYNASIFAMGDDWVGKFDHLKSCCEVIYLSRTADVSSTQLKRLLQVLDSSHVQELKIALDIISSIVDRFE